MAADIIPVLAAITGLDPAETAELFSEAWAEAKAENGGRSDTLTFTEAVMAFRSAAPFELVDLQAAWRAKAEIESEHASAAPNNSLPMPR
jgi:hypothetical protein